MYDGLRKGSGKLLFTSDAVDPVRPGEYLQRAVVTAGTRPTRLDVSPGGYLGTLLQEDLR
jgi:hypothetical protein